MDGRAFLGIARELVSGATEAHRRTAAGRAYYALMLEVRNLLERWGFSRPPRNRIHDFARLTLIYSIDPDLKQVGLTLERLGRLRNDADYHLAGPSIRFLKAGLVEEAIQEAQDAIALLDEVDKDEDRRNTAIQSVKLR